MDETRLKKFASACISAFSRVKPDWQTPHKTFFKVAKTMGLTAIVDGMTEKEYDKSWEKLFEDGTLEGDKVRVVLTEEGTRGSTKLVFTSEDLRHLKRVA